MAIKKWFERCSGILQQITSKDLSNTIFGFGLCCWLIPCVFLNKQTKGFFLNNHASRQVTSDKWYIVTLNLQPREERLEKELQLN